MPSEKFVKKVQAAAGRIALEAVAELEGGAHVLAEAAAGADFQILRKIRKIHKFIKLGHG